MKRKEECEQSLRIEITPEEQLFVEQSLIDDLNTGVQKHGTGPVMVSGREWKNRTTVKKNLEGTLGAAILVKQAF